MPDDVPIKSVDAIRQYIETKKMIERIKSGNIQLMDASLESLERALKDLQQAIEDLKH
jgi:hypothetical protein